LLGAIVLTYGIAADPKTVLSNVNSLARILPGDVAKLIGQELMSVVQTSGGKKGIGLVIAIAVALWGARNAATSIITALNIAYEVKEKRSTIRVNLLALAITAGAVVMAVLALLAMTTLGYVQHLLPQVPGVVLLAGRILSYLLLLLGAAAGAATLYRYAPDRPEAKWQWITPGSLFAALAWVILTFAFGIYVSRFGNYNKTYGSLATVVILVTWLYLSAYLFLIGAELNCEFERQTAKNTTLGAVKPAAGSSDWSDQDAARTQGSVTKSDDGADHSSTDPGKQQPDGGAEKTTRKQPSSVDDYVAGRIANRAGTIAGLRSVGMVSAILSTVGLSLLRRRGRAAAGTALLGTAVGLSLLKRGD
jgi:membrane protein